MENPIIIKDQIKTFLYLPPLQETPVKVNFYKGKVWLTQFEIAKLYGVQRLSIKKHLSNAYKKGKLDEAKVSAAYKLSKDDEALGTNKYYNLEAIKNIGHRINSAYVIKFEKWVEEKYQKLAEGR